MRRRLILTVAASTVMVLLAMLIPMADLVEDYAMEDRLAVAALEVQGTESVVSSRDKGTVAVHLAALNRNQDESLTTVLYPDGTAIGPLPGEGPWVEEARQSGRARVDHIEGGVQFLVPVSLGGSSALPESTPVIRVTVLEQGFGPTVRATWGVLTMLGLVLLAGSLLVADRLGRSFVQPIRSLADAAGRLGEDDLTPVPVEGPAEVQDVGVALNRLVDRVHELLARERENVADLSHRLRTPITALRLSVESLPGSAERDRLTGDVETLQRMVDAVVAEARRSQREGLTARADAVTTVVERAAFWRALAEDQQRSLLVSVPDEPIPVAASESDLAAMLDVLLDNVFSHTPDGATVHLDLVPHPDGGAMLVVDDAGPGFPASVDPTDRGTSGSGSSGLGLAIARRTAEATGGWLELDRSDSGGGRVRIRLGPAR